MHHPALRPPSAGFLGRDEEGGRAVGRGWGSRPVVAWLGSSFGTLPASAAAGLCWSQGDDTPTRDFIALPLEDEAEVETSPLANGLGPAVESMVVAAKATDAFPSSSPALLLLPFSSLLVQALNPAARPLPPHGCVASSFHLLRVAHPPRDGSGEAALAPPLKEGDETVRERQSGRPLEGRDEAAHERRGAAIGGNFHRAARVFTHLQRCRTAEEEEGDAERGLLLHEIGVPHAN